MNLLPTPDEQAWLLNALADLLRRRGSRQFLSMPLVEPTKRFFPDAWSVSVEGLDRITRRLMQYANLADLDVHVGTFQHPGFPSKRLEVGGTQSVAGLFLGLDSNCAFFAFNEDAPDDVEHMAGVMGHEVAHAYRAHHGLVDLQDRDREEWLTDVTGTYLGFGLLLANNSYRYRTSGEVVGAWSTHSWSTHRVGYLSPQAFAFLLAIQLDARGLAESERKRLLKCLEANQSAFAKAALEVVRGWPEETYRLLQFPVEGDEIEDVEPESLLAPLPEYVLGENAALPEGEAAAPEDLSNHGRPVFRVPQSRAITYSLLGLLGGMVVGVPTAALMHWLGPGILLPAGGLALGWKQGATKRYDVCSDPACDHVLAPEAAVCPGCGGTIAGSIRHRNERLDAEEAYERQHGSKRRKRPMKRRKPRA